MSEEEFKDQTTIVIVGHVDHGKSTLIGRFLFDSGNLSAEKLEDIKKISVDSGGKIEFAHVMDQFKEEREKNITIDTSQTFFNLNSKPYVFVDAPGHKEYLKNMITGATQADNALILLDIKEGIKEQTQKHLKILKLLGVKNISVLINKMDLVGYQQAEFERAKSLIEGLFKEHQLHVKNVVPISAYNGDFVVHKSSHMSWYVGPTVLDVVTSLAVDHERVFENNSFALPVQLVHVVGKNSFVLGRIEKGSIKKGDGISVFPTGAKVKVEKIEKYNEKLDRAGQGESVGLLLSSFDGIQRGQVLCDLSNFVKPKRFTAHSFWSSNKNLKKGRDVTIECRTQRVKACVEGIKDEFELNPLEELKEGDLGIVEFSLNSPLLLDDSGVNDPFSRIVFYDEGDIVGCGVVDSIQGEN